MVSRQYPPVFDSRMMRRGRAPVKMSTVRLDPETKERLLSIVVGIFTDCSNVGVPFHEALLAVYISGLENGLSAIDDERRKAEEIRDSLAEN